MGFAQHLFPFPVLQLNTCQRIHSYGFTLRNIFFLHALRESQVSIFKGVVFYLGHNRTKKRGIPYASMGERVLMSCSVTEMDWVWFTLTLVRLLCHFGKMRHSRAYYANSALQIYLCFLNFFTCCDMATPNFYASNWNFSGRPKQRNKRKLVDVFSNIFTKKGTYISKQPPWCQCP